MNTDDLLTFVTAARLLNFSKTAEALNYSQSSVTVQIKKLEQEFGSQLFNRIGKNIALTPAGKQLMHHALTILHAVEEAKKDMEMPEQSEKKLVIGCIDSLANCHMTKVLSKLYDQDIQLSLNIVTSSPRKLFEMLDKNQIDLVYIIDQPIYHQKWIKVLEKVEPLSFITSSRSPWAARSNIRLDELLDEDFFLTETNDNYRLVLDQELAKKNLELVPKLEVSNTDLIVRSLINIGGISFLPDFSFQEELLNRRIVKLPVEGFHLTMSRQLFYHSEKFVTKEMQDLIHIIQTIS